MKRSLILLLGLIGWGLSSPALAASVQIFGQGGATAGTLVDDVSCAADEYLRRNGTDTGWACSAGTATGDSVTVDGAPVTDPDFNDGGDINFTDTANTITATLKDDVVAAAEMADADHGDIAWSAGVATVQDLQCTDCISTAEISDVYLLNSGDVGLGTFDFGGADGLKVPTTTDCSALTTEGHICWDSDDDDLYVGATGSVVQINGAAGGGAPTTVDYLVGTADGTLSAEIVVGTSPGGELGGTWASPTLDDSIGVSSWTCTSCTLPTPTVTTSLTLGTAGVLLSDDGDGTLSILGLGNGSDEALELDFDNVANEITITSATAVDTINFIDGSIPLADLKVADGQFLNMSAIDNSTTTEGLRIPQAANCTTSTAEGQVCWDTDDDQLVIGSTGSTVTISGGGSGDVTAVGDCTTGACFTGATGTTFSSNTDLIMDVDNDNNGIESFQVRNGIDGTVFEVAEDGTATATVYSAPTLTLTGTGTINGLDALDATSEDTVEAAIDTLPNLTSASALATVGTITSGVWNAGAVTSSGAVTTATLELTGTGTINGLDAVDATGETTIDALIFDADAEDITGVWEVQDDVNFNFGTDADWSIQYDEGVDDQLLFFTAGTAAVAITDPMFEILVGTTPTADQQVFGVAKGSQASNTALLTLDEDGDLVVAGTISSAPQATPTVEFRDSDAADGDVNAQIFAQCTDIGSGTEDCDLTLAQQEAGVEKNILVADADGGITIGAAGTNSLTVTLDGTGDAEVVLPNDSIGTAEVLDNTLTATDLAATVTLADADLVSFASVNVTSATEGLILPQHATDCSVTPTAEGQVCWEADADTLYIGNGLTVTSIGAGADVSSVGNCASGACFGGASGTTLTSTTSDILSMATDNAFTYQRNDAGAVTFAGADDAGAADTIYDTTGAGAITVGSADVTAVTVTTDGTGTAEVVLPDGSISTTEILDATVHFDDLDQSNDLTDAGGMDASEVSLGAGGIIFEGSVPNTNETLLVGGNPPGDRTITLPNTTGTLITTGDTGTVTSTMIATEVRSIPFMAAGLSVDGTQCATPTEATINSGPKLYTIICTDNDAATIYGTVHMPDGWDGGTVTFTHTYIQTAVDTGVLNGDIAAQCRGATEVPSSTWGTEVAIDDAAVTGSNANDETDSAAVTPAGTCSGGDMLYWRYQLDATGTTTAVATLHHLGFKLEYTHNIGD